MEELFIAELRERLFAHFVAGRWRVPLAQRQLALGADLPGRIVCADGADVARARAGLGGHCAAPELLWAALRTRAGLLSRLRRREGWPEASLCDTDLPELPPFPEVSGEGGSDGAGDSGWVLLSAAGVPLRRLVPVLIAGAMRGGLIWKPAPGAAASAHLLMDAIGPLAGGRLALLQGDHATGAVVARSGVLIWAGNAPPARALPPPALCLGTALPGAG